MSWGPGVGGLGAFVRLDDTGGGVEHDAGVCMPLSLGEVEADEESLFMDDERSCVTCVPLSGTTWGTGEAMRQRGHKELIGPTASKPERPSQKIKNQREKIS